MKREKKEGFEFDKISRFLLLKRIQLIMASLFTQFTGFNDLTPSKGSSSEK